MPRYETTGRTVDTAATANNVAAALWNPSTTKPLWVAEAHIFLVGATISNMGVVRTTTRGTQTTTVTPDIDNDYDAALAPATGALLDIAYSAQPTVASPYLRQGSAAAAQGAGFMWVWGSGMERKGIKVLPGTGLAIATPVAVILQDSDVTFVWDE